MDSIPFHSTPMSDEIWHFIDIAAVKSAVLSWYLSLTVLTALSLCSCLHIPVVKKSQDNLVRSSFGFLLQPELHKLHIIISIGPTWAGLFIFLQFISSYSSPPSLFFRHGSFPHSHQQLGFEDLALPIFFTWSSSLPLDYLITFFSLWNSQHKYQLFRGTFLDFSNSNTTHHHFLFFKTLLFPETILFSCLYVPYLPYFWNVILSREEIDKWCSVLLAPVVYLLSSCAVPDSWYLPNKDWLIK